MHRAAMLIALALMAISTLLAACSANNSDFVKTDIRGIGAATIAKEVCSAVFISGFTPQSFLATNSKFWLMPADRLRIGDVNVDRERRIVSLRIGDRKGQAVFTGARGCVAFGPDHTPPDISYAALPTVRFNDEVPWPAGDKTTTSAWPAGLKRKSVSRALDAAFAADAHTAAILVVYRGQLVGERYAPAVTPQTRLPGWSIAKTLQATLVGILEQDDRLQLRKPVPIEAWRSPDDPRRNTTLADLLRMSAPISCGNTQSWHSHAGWPASGYPESLYVFSGPRDAYGYSISRPPVPEDEPRGVYTNCQPLIIGHILQRALGASGVTIDEFAQRRLYEPLGMNAVVIEPDRAGNPLTAGYAYATARDWTRLGMLYANDGVWNGRQLLSPEFMALVRAPAPHWQRPRYGGQVWLHADGCIFGQCDAYQFNGIEGQRVIIFPSLDLVVARFGFGAGDVPSADSRARRPAIEALNAAVKELLGEIARPGDADELRVVNVLETFFSSLGAADRERFDSTIADNFRLLEDGEVWSPDYLFARITQNDRQEKWTLSQKRITVAGDMAVVEYRNTGSFVSSSGRQIYEWVESAVLVRRAGDWRIALLHSTLVDQVREQ